MKRTVLVAAGLSLIVAASVPAFGQAPPIAVVGQPAPARGPREPWRWAALLALLLLAAEWIVSARGRVA